MATIPSHSATQGIVQDLWAITCFFNPASYRRRYANYQVFRRQLGIPLIAVELSFNGAFELRPGDAEILVQRCGGDVMWQKERLLNIALGALPDQCRKVVWLDCDIVFERVDWPTRVSRALDTFPMVQPFSKLGHLPADIQVPKCGFREASVCWQSSLAFDASVGRRVVDGLRLNASTATEKSTIEMTTAEYWARVATFATPGLAWAARRELLERFGFYDVGIVGGGDVSMACAAYGCFQDLVRYRAMSGAEQDHYLAWAEAFFDVVRSAVGHVDGEIYHLWHGGLVNRRYRERRMRLRDLGFDPRRDIALADSGAWRWNSDKPLLHQYVKDYFAARKEDG